MIDMAGIKSTLGVFHMHLDIFPPYSYDCTEHPHCIDFTTRGTIYQMSQKKALC